MSNMLQAVSILYKTRLPIIVVFNKIDVVRQARGDDGLDGGFRKVPPAVDQESRSRPTSPAR